MKRRIIATGALLALVLMAGGCVSVGDNPNRKVSPPVASPDVRMLAGAILPAIYQGDLPCADCSALRYTLDVRADRVFFLRTTYVGKGSGAGESVDDIGTWSLTPDAQNVVLKGAGDTKLMFSIENSETLLKLDGSGKPIESNLNYELKRNASYRPLEPRVAMRGMYVYMADAANFRECRTQMKMRVAPSSEGAALERTYQATRKVPGEELLVDLEGQIATRPNEDSGNPIAVLLVEHLTKVWSGAGCDTNVAE
ncbi:MAG TPA: copper resistance protein NlpE N-terminal domain-containing protein [Steroidobacteraceae bacterium]|nr:copper resistance protein NlpE N-terminal domain-containing protein [Steroidobacteraceae bacterium]